MRTSKAPAQDVVYESQTGPRFRGIEARSIPLPIAYRFSRFGTVSDGADRQALAGLSSLSSSRSRFGETRASFVARYPSVVITRDGPLRTSPLPTPACVARTSRVFHPILLFQESFGPDPAGGFVGDLPHSPPSTITAWSVALSSRLPGLSRSPFFKALGYGIECRDWSLSVQTPCRRKLLMRPYGNSGGR